MQRISAWKLFGNHFREIHKSMRSFCFVFWEYVRIAAAKEVISSSTITVAFHYIMLAFILDWSHVACSYSMLRKFSRCIASLMHFMDICNFHIHIEFKPYTRTHTTRHQLTYIRTNMMRNRCMCVLFVLRRYSNVKWIEIVFFWFFPPQIT